ncbi:MAG TPA: hypothetical protein VGJ18_11225 [Gemmatimonadaceae bacterium]|jgi:hypothetical protein
MTTHPVAHPGSSCETVGVGSCALGLVGSLPAHAPSVARPAMAPADRILRAYCLTLTMERSVNERARYVRRDRSTGGYAE